MRCNVLHFLPFSYSVSFILGFPFPFFSLFHFSISFQVHLVFHSSLVYIAREKTWEIIIQVPHLNHAWNFISNLKFSLGIKKGNGYSFLPPIYSHLPSYPHRTVLFQR